MEFLSANLASKARREEMHGRSYLVAPATLIVPGVLNGSDGAIYYPEDETEKSAPDWNEMPIVVEHPTRNGKFVSARSPAILREFGIGKVYESTFDGKHTAEAWFDEKLTKNYDKKHGTDIYNRVERGEPIELSTGLKLTKSPGAGEHNGRPYTSTARNYKPDHLAILPNGKGACSLADGCGVNNAEDDCDRWVTISGNPTCIKGDEIASGPLKGLGAGKDRDKAAEEKRFQKASKQTDDRVRRGETKQQVAERRAGAKDKNFDSPHYKALSENFGKGVADKVISKLPENADRSHIAKALKKMGLIKDTVRSPYAASNIVKNETANALPNQPKSQNTGRYKRMGSGTGKGEYFEAAQRGAMTLTDNDRELGKAARAEKLATGNNPASWVEDEAVWEKAKNAAAGGGYEEDSEHYWAVVSHIYQKMGGTVKSHANNSDGNGGAGGEEIRPAPIEEREMSKDKLVETLVGNCDCWKGQADVLNKLPEETLKKLIANAKKAAEDALVCNAAKEHLGEEVTAETIKKLPKAKIVANETCPECKGAMKDGECEECGYKAEGGKKPPFVKNERTKPTLQEWEDSMPAEAREVWNAAKKLEKTGKQQLVRKLVANISDPDARAAKVKRLLSKSYEDLEEMAELMPSEPVHNRRGRDEEEDADYSLMGDDTAVENAAADYPSLPLPQEDYSWVSNGRKG